MRWSGVAFLLIGLNMAVPGTPGIEPVAANGCTPCQCGVAHCEGNRTYWPVIDLEVPKGPLVAGRAVNVTWHQVLVPGNASWPPANGTWGMQGLRTVLYVVHMEDETSDDGVRDAPWNETGLSDSNDTLFPSDHQVTVVFPVPGTYLLYVKNEYRDWSDEATVTVLAEEPRESATSPATEDGGPGPATPRPSPALPGLACLAGLAIVVAARRRFS